jgi:hypothetical protein
MDQEVERTAVAGMFNLADVLELVVCSWMLSMMARLRSRSWSARGNATERMFLRSVVMSWSP